MKIGNLGITQTQAQQLDKTKSEKSDKPSSTDIVGSWGASDAAKVSLSERAQEIAKAKEIATPTFDIDEEKVARLQGLIDSGKYSVDSEAVADRMLQEHGTLFE